MRFGDRSIIFVSLGVILLSGCSDHANKGAKLLYSEATQTLESSKTGQKSYAEVLVSYQTAKDRIERILREFPSSEIAVGLSSGGTAISGLTLEQFRELEATLKELVKAEQDPLACALLIANSMESPQVKSGIMVEIAGKVAESGQKDKALQLLSQAVELAKLNTWPELRLMCAIAVKYAETGQPKEASRILSRARIVARTAKGPYDGVPLDATGSIPDIAVHFAEVGDFYQAFETVQLLEGNPQHRLSALAGIAGAYAEAGDFAQAVKTVNWIDHGSSARDGALLRIAGEYAENGDFDQALGTANMIVYAAKPKASALVKIASKVAETGQKERATQLLSQAVETLGGHDAYQSSRLYAEIAFKYAEWGDLDQAMKVAGKVQDWRENAWVLAEMAGKHAQAGDFYRAIEITREVHEKSADKSRALAMLAREYALAGQQEHADQLLSEAIETTQTTEGSRGQAAALVSIAAEYARTGQTERTAQILAQAYEEADTKNMGIYLGWTRSEFSLFMGIVKAYRGLGQQDQAEKLLSEALSTAMRIKRCDDKAEALFQIACEYAETGRKEQTLRILSKALEAATTTVVSETLSDWELTELAIKYAMAGDFDQATTMVNIIREADGKSSALAGLACEYAKIGQKEQASETLSQAIEAAKTAEDAFDKSYAFWVIADKLAEAGQKEQASEILARALDAAKTMEDAHGKSSSLARIAGEYRKLGQDKIASQTLSHAVDAARTMGDAKWKSSMLAYIAGDYAESGRREQALLILSEALELNGALSADDKSTAVARIAGGYAKAGEKEQASRFLAQALDTVGTIENAGLKAEILTEIAREYAKSGQRERALHLVSQAIKVARTIEHAEDKEWALTDIAFLCEEGGFIAQAIEAAEGVDEFGKTLVLSGIAAKVALLGEDDKATLSAVTHAIRPLSELLK